MAIRPTSPDTEGRLRSPFLRPRPAPAKRWPNPSGKTKGINSDALIDAFNRNGGLIRATARELDCDSANVSRRIMRLYDAGDERIDPKLLFKDRLPVGAVVEEIARARVELGMRNEAKVKKGDWRKPSLISKCGTGPIILGIFGDPHLDKRARYCR